MPKAVHTPDAALSNGQYLNISMLFECLALDTGTHNLHTSSSSLERRFLSSLSKAEMASGVRRGFGITGMQAKTFITHYRDLVTTLAGVYLVDPECYGDDLLSAWPNLGTGARLILDAYRVEAIRLLDMGSEDALSLLGLDGDRITPAIGTEHFNLMAALRDIHVARLKNLMS